MLREGILALLWTLARLLLALRYRIVGEGTEHVPAEGPVLLLGNHVSWLDWMLVQIPLKRRVRFMMDREIYEWRSLNWMFRLGQTIPVSPKAAKGAFAEAEKALKSGDVLAVFPEGHITRTCEIEKFYRGFEIIAKQVGEGVIVPFYIDGMCGSRWSYSRRRYVPFRSGLRRRVSVTYGEPLPMQSGAEAVRDAVIRLKETRA